MNQERYVKCFNCIVFVFFLFLGKKFLYQFYFKSIVCGGNEDIRMGKEKWKYDRDIKDIYVIKIINIDMSYIKYLYVNFLLIK